MKKPRYTDKQVFAILSEYDAGVSTADLCRKYAISAATFYKWKSKYAGASLSLIQENKSVTSENKKLKNLVAELLLDNRMLKDVNGKKW